MLKNGTKKLCIIVMSVLFTLTLIPASALAGNTDTAKVKMASTKNSKSKKTQDGIKKTENQLKATKEDILTHMDDIQYTLEDEVIPLLMEIDSSIDGGIDNLNEEDYNAIDEAITNISDAGDSINQDLKTLETKYKKLQKIKKTKPESYLKELQKILVQYNDIEDELTDVDGAIEDLTDLLNGIVTDINAPSDDTNTDPNLNPDQPGDTIISGDTVINDQPTDTTNPNPDIATSSSLGIIQ